MSAAADGTESIDFGGVIPVLRVADVRASEEYYVQKLGFQVDFRTPGFISVTRGGTRLFLCEGDQGHAGAWVWISVPDVEKVHAEFVASGATIRNPPTNYQWALEMQVVDLDGNVLRIGSDPKAQEPIGNWLDMNGVRWKPRFGGGWRRADS